MMLAYADPPYLGCSHLYPEHPHSRDYDKPEAHGQLMERMESAYDGWALSLSSPSLRQILPLAPEGSRVAAWVKPFAAFKRNVRCAYTWEPVIFKPARDRSADGAPVTRDHLSESITLRRGLTGAKPEAFCRWVLNLLGYIDGDYVEDLFPGTGVMMRVLGQRSLEFYVGGDADAVPGLSDRGAPGIHVTAGASTPAPADSAESQTRPRVSAECLCRTVIPSIVWCPAHGYVTVRVPDSNPSGDTGGGVSGE